MWKTLSLSEQYLTNGYLLVCFCLFLICTHHISFFWGLLVILGLFWLACGPVQYHGDSKRIPGDISCVGWAPWWTCGGKPCPYKILEHSTALSCGRVASSCRGSSAAPFSVSVPCSAPRCRHKCPAHKTGLCHVWDSMYDVRFLVATEQQWPVLYFIFLMFLFFQRSCITAPTFSVPCNCCLHAYLQLQ